MDYSLIPTTDGILVRLGKRYLDAKVNLNSLDKAFAFRNEKHARLAIKSWVMS